MEAATVTEGGENWKKRRSFRSDHRSRSHESAHSEGETLAPESDRVAHPFVPSGDISLITTPDALSQLIDRLRTAGSFAYDSEFIGELTYFPKLCLIQVASRQEVALIDPLADLSLVPFWDLLCDPNVEKIVHAGSQDIEPVIRHTGRSPVNVFDTQVSAGFAGLPYPISLSKLVMELAGARLGKGLTFSHWDQRPLSAMQLRYAADDVRYLPLVRQKLGERLKSLGHEKWAAEQCATLCDVTVYRFDPATQYLRVRGAAGLPPRNVAVLRELTAWRDSAARAHDVPPRTFLRDEVMIDLARNPVKAVEKLSRVRGLPRPVEHAHGAHLVELTLKALELPASSLPPERDPEPSPTEKFSAEALWAAAQCLCAGRSIDPASVTDRGEVGDFVLAFHAKSKLEAHPLMTGWRREAIGNDLVALLSGTARLEITWSDGMLKASVNTEKHRD
jgi:ribonuclease D